MLHAPSARIRVNSDDLTNNLTSTTYVCFLSKLVNDFIISYMLCISKKC